MRILLVFFFVSIFLTISQTKGVNFLELQRILAESNQSPFVNLLLIYDSSTETGQHLDVFMKLMTQKKSGYYKVEMIDCNTEDQNVMKNFPYCGQQIRSQLPALLFTQPALNSVNPQSGSKGEAKHHQYQGQLQQKSLYDFAVPLMRAFSINIKKMRDWNLFKQKYPKIPKILYFTDKDKLPPIFKALTANFRSTIAFGHVFKNNPLCAQLNITKFPTLLLNGEKQITLSKDLNEMIQRLKVHEGEQEVIYISELQQKKQELNKENIQKLVYETPRHILIHVNNLDGRVHPEWKKSQQSFKKMFDYYQTDELAQELGVKQTPAIVYFPKSLAKKKVQKTVFYPKDTFRQIYDQISSMIEDFSVPLANDMQMQKLTSIPLQQDKMVAVLFHSDQISLSYRFLSNQQAYKQNLVFFRMRDPDQDVMKKFQLTKLPALFVMLNDNSEQAQKQLQKKNQNIPQGKKQLRLKIAQYTGKYNYDDLSTYLGMFVQSKKQTNPSTEQDTENNFSGRLTQIDSSKSFKKNCQDESCYLLLVDGSSQNSENNQKYKNQVGKFVNKIHDNFGVVDALCHTQILVALDIQQEDLPTFIYINPKFEKYSRIIGRIQQKAISSMISKIRANKASYRAYDALSFSKKNCQQEHQKLKSYKTEGQAALTQQQAQILQQIKEQEQKKKQQAQKSGQGQQQKKTKKRRRRPKQLNSEEL